MQTSSQQIAKWQALLEMVRPARTCRLLASVDVLSGPALLRLPSHTCPQQVRFKEWMSIMDVGSSWGQRLAMRAAVSAAGGCA